LGNQAPLTNGLVVENRTTTIGPTGIPMIGALSSTSTIQGNIAAVGTNVFSFLGPESRLPKSTGVLSGTSMAAPQVAGLAGSMLAIRPSLSAQDIVSKVIQARFIEDNSPTPAIDAYAAVLSLDASLADAPARSALLMPSSAQVSAGGTFGTSEAREFLKAYFPAIYGGSSPAGQLEFSHFDLNGDGYTGGASKKPFDLKFALGNEMFIAEKLAAYPNGRVVSLDESNVTDFEVLCYYIYSPLFSGDIAEVERQLSTGDLSCPGRGPGMLGETLTFARRWPTPDTPFPAFGPDVVVPKVAAGPSDAFIWSGWLTVNPEEATIEFTNRVPTGWGNGVRGEFDGIVIYGFSAAIESVSVNNQMGGVISVSHTGSTILIGLNSQSLPQTYFPAGGKFILTVKLRQ
jgi:hypothetical protein